MDCPAAIVINKGGAVSFPVLGGTTMAFAWKWAAAGATLALIGMAGAQGVVSPAAAQAVAAQTAAVQVQPAAPRAPAAGDYYVEFRAADIGVYGHSYIAFGRLGAGGRPASVQYADFHPEGGTLGLAVGHAVPVAADMTPEKETLTLPITSSFRRAITAAQYQKVLATIKRVHANNHVWSALAYNCNSFVGDVAEAVGMKTPTSLLFSTSYIPALRYLNDPAAQTAAVAGATPATRAAAPRRHASPAAPAASSPAPAAAPKRAPQTSSVRPPVTRASVRVPAASGSASAPTVVY